MSQQPKRIILTVLTLLATVQASNCRAGGFGFRNNAVGGIAIDAQGVLTRATVVARKQLRDELIKNFVKPGASISETVPLRMISLRGIEEAARQAVEKNFGVLPDHVQYLGGLQRIEYVLVYPEENDIVLAGPGEGWKIRGDGSVVGMTTGRPVIHIDDLLIALRSVANAQAGISCSIDPTAEGRKRLSDFLAKQNRFRRSMLGKIRRVMGNQTITVSGVPSDSHFARVLVGADYRMKRIAMNLDPSPVESLPGFLDLLKTQPGGLTSATPRWWLACNYQSMVRSADGLAWQLRGQGVKALTENDFVDGQGVAQRTGVRDPIAERWANLMTQHYDQLSVSEPIFGQLRNLMDLCVASAIIARDGLLDRANCSLPFLMSPDSPLMTDSWNPA